MSKRRAMPVQLAPWTSAFIGGIEWANSGTDWVSEMQVFVGANDVSQLRQRFRDELRAEVTAMLVAIGEFDAFDIIELVRLRELPIVPVTALAGGYDGSGTAIDLVSLVCLSRPDRIPAAEDSGSARPDQVVEELHTRANRLLRACCGTG